MVFFLKSFSRVKEFKLSFNTNLQNNWIFNYKKKMQCAHCQKCVILHIVAPFENQNKFDKKKLQHIFCLSAYISCMMFYVMQKKYITFKYYLKSYLVSGTNNCAISRIVIFSLYYSEMYSFFFIKYVKIFFFFFISF